MKRIFLSSLFAATSLLGALAAAPTVTSLGPVNGTFVAPSRVAVDAQANLFVVDPPAGRITVLDAFNRVVAVRDIASPLAIAVASTGQRYVGEADRGSVSVFDAQWNRVSQLGAGTNEFLQPGYVALDESPDGLLVYVSDGPAQEVKVYREGTLLRRFGALGSGSGQFNFPAGLWVSPAGDLFVVDQNNDRVQVFSRAGTFLRAFTLRPPGVSGRSGRAQGIVGDAQGRLYVADTFQGYVKAFATNGAFLGYVGGYGQLSGQTLTPAGVVLDAQGRLFVASVNTARVEAFGLDCFTRLTVTPASPVAAVGSTVVLNAQSVCPGPFTYQWRKGTTDLVDGGVISGASTATLTLTGVTTADAGGYSVVVSDGSSTNVSPSATLRVTAAPTISMSPTSRSVIQGGSTAFVVSASGEGLSYRWFFKGMQLAVPDAANLVLTSIQPNAAGNYWVVASNVAGQATSAQATLTVLQTPVFTLLPLPQTVPEGGTATFSALAVGNEPLRYLWLRNGAVIVNQTNATIVLTNLTPAFNGSIVARAYNSYGTSNSPGVNLTVLPDTNAPVALAAVGGRLTNRTVLVSFSKPLSLTTAQRVQNYQVFGPGGLTVISALVQNSTNVLLTLSGFRTPNANYSLRITGVTDSAYLQNVVSPNPTTLSIATTVDLITINTQPWKYLQIANASMDAQPWKLPTYSDSSWSNGFGIFYGNISNNITQPNPNPGVTLPFTLSTTDPLNHRVFTVLNNFTNVGGTLQEFTYYFRTPFYLNAETNGLTLRMRAMVDDGAVLYLNGAEKTRIRMAAAPTTIFYSSLANAAGNQTWEPALTNAGTALTLVGWRPGTNVLAVEIHQNATTSDDVTFGLQMEATLLRFATPPVLSVARAPGGDLTFSWLDPFYGLESAPSLDGPWQTLSVNTPFTVPGAVVAGTPGQFFRLKRQ